MSEPDIVYQVFALSFEQQGAVRHFAENLPPSILREGGRGYAEFYESLLSFYHKTASDPVDKVAFRSWLENETNIYEALGGKEGVTEYLDAVTGVELSNPVAVTNLLRLRYSRRKQKEYSEELAELLTVSGEDNAEQISQLARKIDQLNQGTYDPLQTVFSGDQIADRAEGLWELPDFLATPFPSLNKALGYSEDAGFCRGGVYAILAPSGKGKSSFAKTLMNHWVDNGYNVLYVNYEEAVAHWERILFTQVTKQNIYKGAEISELDKKHYTKMFQDKMRQWDSRFMVKHDPETPYFEDLETWIRDIPQHNDVPDVIIIDTIQSLFLKRGQGMPRWGQYEEMMVRLEKLAKDLDSSIIITAQENSNRMKEKREVVQQSDIGGSLSIAQKSSATIFITDAKTQMGDDTLDETIMQLQIPKNRITGIVFMVDPPLVKYEDDIKSYVKCEEPPIDRYKSDYKMDDFDDIHTT